MIERRQGRQEGVPEVDGERILAMIRQALKARQDKEGIFAGEIVPPEKAFITLAKTYAEKETLEVFPLHALFFLTTTLFADATSRQFKRVSDPPRFQKYAWLFRPEEVVQKSAEEVTGALKEFIIPASYNKKALGQWRHNAQVLVENYKNDLGNFFAEYNCAPKRGEVPS